MNGKTRVMCDDCSDLPKGSPRRLEDLCQECWTGLEQSHVTFPLWKDGLSEEEVLTRQAIMLQGAGRFFHQAYCRKCWKGFGRCEALVEAAKREDVAEGI